MPATFLDDLMALAPPERVKLLVRPEVRAAVAKLTGTLWYPWLDDPVGFTEGVLRESIWSGQAAILRQLARPNARLAVVACHGPGKTRIAARAAAWWIAVHPPGTAQVVTTAPTFRQVRLLLWPHIRDVHQVARLPGRVGITEWHIGREVVAFGFSPREGDPAAAQGIHAPFVLVIADEAGGISTQRGEALEGLMATGDARLLAIGNAPLDAEADDTWFGRIYASPRWGSMRISAFDTPNLTGEPTGLCNCSLSGIRAHAIAEHLVTRLWIEGVAEEFGTASAYYIARVLGEFPSGVSAKVIPMAWLEDAVYVEGEGWPGVGLGATVGVDVAADGGDEFVVAASVQGLTRILYARSGPANADNVDVAGVVFRQVTGGADVDHAGVLSMHRAAGGRDRLRVKVDALGVGWGVVGTLRAMIADAGLERDVEVVPVLVSESPRTPEGQRKFRNKRAEMWWNGRQLVQASQVRLDVDRPALGQLWGPTYHSTSSGKIQIESKDLMQRRGLASPDRAEACLLAWYEPDPPSTVTTTAAAMASQRIATGRPGAEARRPWAN